MLGLGVYDSSSEEEIETKVPSGSKVPNEGPVAGSDDSREGVNNRLGAPKPPASTNPSEILSGPILGPASGPTPMGQTYSPNARLAGDRSSPFSATRALIQDLTLPPVPNLDIPPSPPGSPNAAANAKFEHFLSLKKQGVHFNLKLASSSSLKNPSLLMKMMDHAGIDEQSQYNTSLSTELWDTSNLPKWGYKEELLRTQQDVRHHMEENKGFGQRSSLEFAPGSTTNASRSFGLEVKKKSHP